MVVNGNGSEDVWPIVIKYSRYVNGIKFSIPIIIWYDILFLQKKHATVTYS